VTVPLPLGWMLSNRAAEAIQRELYDEKLWAGRTPSPHSRRIRKGCHIKHRSSRQRLVKKGEQDAQQRNASEAHCWVAYA